MAKQYKEMYPPGTRLELISMDDPYAPVPPGTRGTVQYVDDAAQIGMKWDDGRTLSLIPGEDSFRKLTEEKLKDENQSHRCPDCNRSNKHDKQSFFRRHSLHSLTLPAPPSETHPGSLFGIRLSKNSDKIADSSFFLCKDTKNSYFCAGVSLIRPAPTDSPR